MATQRVDITGKLNPTGACFWAPVETQLTMTNDGKKVLVLVMPDPGGVGDHGAEGSFLLPSDYVGSPVLRIRGILDGTPANTLGFGFKAKKLADSEAYDAAYGTEDIASNGTWTGYADEDVYEDTITLTNFASGLAADDSVDFFFYIDDGVASAFTGNFLLLQLVLEYSDA